MPNLIKEAKYILSNVQNNNNKFWYIQLFDDNSTITQNGRVGKSAATHLKNHSSQYDAEQFFRNKCHEKEMKGYKPLNVIGIKNEMKVSNVSNIQLIAKNQIKTNNSTVAKLIEYFTKVNAHNITFATGGQITYSNSTGLFSTPLGIVTQDNINKANNILVEIGEKISKRDYSYTLERLTNNYMMLVPQDIGMRRLDIRSFWDSLDSVQTQKSIVDSLQASLVQASKPSNGEDKVHEEKVFDVQLDLIDDEKVINHVIKQFNESKNSVHVSGRFKVKKVYAVKITSEQKAFQDKGQKVGNVMELWHGTRVSNVLSILKGGLIIPPSSSAHCTGRMFGDGLYFSDQSTKSLNYACGYWGGNKDNNPFMFLTDVAMGKSFIPKKSYGNHYPINGYDSTFAKSGVSGVLNNEMIVYKTYQASLKYLIEFSN